MIQNPRLPYIKEKVHNLTFDPGVYLMKDKTGQIIYVGKAKSLKKRVSSYFRENANHDDKVRKMVSHVYDFDYIVTDSEFEALVLECSLIKQHTPKYNILLKDDKGYHYVMISAGDYPRISAEKQKVEAGEYLGPYTSSFAVKQSVDEANRVFMLPTCSRKFPQEFRKSRPCLNYYIKQCMGVCRGRISPEEYRDTVNQAIDYIRGGSVNSVKNLTAQMEEAAEALDFERAARLRDRIQAIQKIAQSQKIIRSKEVEQDVIAFAGGNGLVCGVVLKFRGGRLVDKDTHLFSDTGEVSAVRQEFLSRYYLGRSEIPKVIAVDELPEDSDLIRDLLEKTAGKKVRLFVPQRGQQRQLLEMAYHNAAEQLSQKTSYSAKEVAALDELGKLLGLPEPPNYIESYDISNLGDSGVVAGMVVFENAQPLKSAYKRFSMKEVVGQNDYACMQEVLRRRFNRYFEQKETGKGFGRMPDLILLDGGKGHVSAVQEVLDDLGISVPLFGMVKDDRHRTRAIAKNGGEIAITTFKSAFRLISSIQDEVHRFAISYQRNVRKKSTFSMRLTEFEGIGPKKAEKLLKAFKTKTALQQATAEELAAVVAMPLEKAEKFRAFLQTI